MLVKLWMMDTTPAAVTRYTQPTAFAPPSLVTPKNSPALVRTTAPLGLAALVVPRLPNTECTPAGVSLKSVPRLFVPPLCVVPYMLPSAAAKSTPVGTCPLVLMKVVIVANVGLAPGITRKRVPRSLLPPCEVAPKSWPLLARVSVPVG